MPAQVTSELILIDLILNALPGRKVHFADRDEHWGFRFGQGGGGSCRQECGAPPNRPFKTIQRIRPVASHLVRSSNRRSSILVPDRACSPATAPGAGTGKIRGVPSLLSRARHSGVLAVEGVQRRPAQLVQGERPRTDLGLVKDPPRPTERASVRVRLPQDQKHTGKLNFATVLTGQQRSRLRRPALIKSTAARVQCPGRSCRCSQLAAARRP